MPFNSYGTGRYGSLRGFEAIMAIEYPIPYEQNGMRRLFWTFLTVPRWRLYKTFSNRGAAFDDILSILNRCRIPGSKRGCLEMVQKACVWRKIWDFEHCNGSFSKLMCIDFVDLPMFYSRGYSTLMTWRRSTFGGIAVLEENLFSVFFDIRRNRLILLYESKGEL